MKINPYIAVIAAATIGGSSVIFIRLLNLPVTSIAFFRMFVPTIVLLGYLFWKKIKLFRGDYKSMLLASSLNAARMFLYIIAFLYTSIGNGVVILFTWPVFATLFGAFFLKEKVTKRTALLIGMAFLGIIVMYFNQEVGFENRDFIGMGAMLLSAILFASTTVIFKKKLEEYSKTETVFYQNLVGAIIFLPFIFINAPVPGALQMSMGILYAVLAGLVTFMLFFTALKAIKMSHYSVLVYWEIPAAIFYGYVFFQEKITVNILIGGGLILLAGLLLIKERPKAKKNKSLPVPG